jgi:succinate-acetate transporter protein
VSESTPNEADVRRIVQDETRGMGQVAPEPPISDPAPVGLAGFALTTFIISVVNAGWISDPNLIKIFVPLGLVYGGVVQLVAGFFEYRNQNVFGSTAFNAFGAFWISLAILVQFGPQLGIPQGAEPIVIGWTLLAWSIFTAIMLVASFGVSISLAIAFALLLVTFILLTIGQLLGPMTPTGAPGPGAIWIKAGGYFGLVTAVVAWYITAAGVINGTYGRAILPVGQR